jgi:hypothetical protein
MIFWVKRDYMGGWEPVSPLTFTEDVSASIIAIAQAGTGIAIAGTNDFDGEWTLGVNIDAGERFLTRDVPPGHQERRADAIQSDGQDSLCEEG